MPNETETDFDFDARYTVESYPGIAFRAIGYETWKDEDYYWSGIECENRDMIRAVMVGDDYVHLIDRSEFTPISEEDYCSCCGQIGCPWG